MKYINHIQRTAMLLVLLLAGWATGCPVSAQIMVDVIPDPSTNLTGTDNANAVQPLETLNVPEYGVSFTFSQASGTNAPAYYRNGSNIRLYKSNTFKVESSDYIIKQIDFHSVEYRSDETTLVGESGEISYDKETFIYTWVNTALVNEASFSIANNQLRIESLRLTLEANGVETIIKAPVFSQNSCDFYQSFDLTISDINEPAASVYYTMDGSTPSAENGTEYTAPITIPEGKDVTVKAISVSGNNVSAVTSATYHFIAKYLLSVKIPNKNGIGYVYYSSDSEYGEWRTDGSVYITNGQNVYIGYYVNNGYKCKSLTLNGVPYNTADPSLSFLMPTSDVELIIDTEFDPSSPSDPQPGESIRKYNLILTANPTDAAYLNGGGSYEAGRQVFLNAVSRSGYVFSGWTKDGQTIRTEPSFWYTMPSSDVVLTANYVYNPTNPSDPEKPALKHPLTVIASPAGSGSFNYSDSQVTSGEEYYVEAYPWLGYKFKGWIVNGVAQEETSPQLTGVMTEAGAQVVGLFTFDPTSPSNPAANYYDPETGLVIIDDFTQGNLSSALDKVVGYGNYGNISSLIVKGRMDSNDYGKLSSLTNAATIDLSRTGGVSSIPVSTFQGLAAANILLSSATTKIGNFAFLDCSNLSSLTVYAQEPPKCSSYTFNGLTNKDNCTVFVPESAIELYANADYWKDFTILPITDDAHVLQVNLPADAVDGRYKNNTIELVNLNSGVRQKYVISDRLLYTFNGLRKDEQYNVYMLSQAGLELGRIENILVPDADFEVTFDKLKSMYSVNAVVKTPDGKDVTSNVAVEWLKPLADGTTTYLRKATSLGEIPEGQVLICRVTLDNQLGSAYAMPEDTEFTVGNEQNTCTINLVPFRSIALSGTVIDGDGAALSGASVSVNQTLNDKFSKSYTAKTDRKGLWSISVLDAPETRITYAATECVNVNDTIGAFAPEISTVDLGKTTLKSIVGARVTYGFSYHAAGSDDVQDYYSDYQNVLVSVFNVTQNRAHNDVSLQYPILAVLDENINTGDELRLTATSKNGAFSPIVEIAKVGENQRAEVTFDIVGKGGIAAAFEMTDNPAVIAMLYTSKGELLKKQTYSEAKTTFTELEDGEYTLVSMGQSDLMNSILRLSNFSEIGLTEGKDYVKNSVKVEIGKLSEVKNAEIPAFDESLFYYTTSSTSFSSNKSSITTGNYLTLRAAIDFKGVYKNDVSNVALVVDLPEACDLVEQSVIQGPNLLPYTYDNHRLTVQLGNNYTSQTRFCVIPTTGGSFNATASIVFDYNGRTLTQPIGSAISEIKDIEISVPSVVSTPQFSLFGKGQSGSQVTIFADNTIIGNGRILSNNMWEVSCNLPSPTNLAEYNVYARITTPGQLQLLTETRKIQYINNYPSIKTVTMHTNPEVIFDFTTGQTSQSWYYYPASALFTLDFTDNSPEFIQEVYLNIFGEDGTRKVKECTYDSNKDIWFANVDFQTYNGLVNLSVNYIGKGDYTYDSAQANLLAKEQEDIIEEVKDKSEELADAVDEVLDYINSGKHSKDEIISFVTYVKDIVITYYGPHPPDDPVEDGFNDLIDVLEDPDYEGGKVRLYGDREQDQDPKLQPFWAELESPYNKSVSVPGNNATNTVTSSNETPGYVVAGDFDFESLAENFDGNANFTISNSKGERWDCQNDFSATIDMESPESVKQYFDQAHASLVESAAQWGTSASGAISELSIAANTAQVVQARYFSANFDQLVAIAGSKNPAVQREAQALTKSIQGNLNSMKNAKTAGNVLSYIGAFCGGWDVGTDLTVGYSRYDEWTYIINSIESSCKGEDVEPLIKKAKKYRNWVLKRDGGKAIGDIGTTALGIGGTVAAGATGGISLTLNLVAAGAGMGLRHWQNSYVITNTQHIAEITRKARNSIDCPQDPFPTGYPGNPYYSGAYPNSPYYGDYTPNNPPFNPLTINHDPAGFVYEAVPTNRVEGVQATIYYKETKEDMYGDPYEEIVLWNAEEYAQENPLFTDENGMYRWDVPQGLWQVKFEKDGYVTAYSEWLPVPPPQLEVNIGIVQNKQPEVTEARAYEEGVEVQFDKFMDLSTLTTDNIYVTANGEKLNGSIRLIDSALADEYASEDDEDATRYASRVRFVPEESLSVTTGEIRVTVSRNVLSYAGIPMTETFSQVLDVEKEVQMIAADDVKVLYGGEKEVTVYVLPYEAAVGRTLRIANSSELITSVDKTEATLDEEGKATLLVKGDLPGRAQLTFSIEDVTVTGECAVDVVTEIINAEAPKASRASGTAVYRGTKVELTTESKDGVIYFTTDGSCPCDENGTRRKYTVPIIINDDTQILAMTTVGTGDDDVSETVEFNYTLKRSDMDFAMNEGWTWISHNFETPVATETLAADENVHRVMSQTQEAIRDPQLGMVGLLRNLNASESYKVETTAATARKRLSEIAWNPATPIALNSGWNWLGYPVGQTMSVDEAFSPTDAENLDVIIGQNGFAQFDGENWVGTLDILSPGLGYMYQSQSAKNVVYNTSIVSTASSHYVPGISQNSPLVLDIHKYPSIMPVVAAIIDMDGMSLDNKGYQVNAFCGTECRGIGRVVNGLVMMNVYGNIGDKITFQVTDNDCAVQFANTACLTFGERVDGNLDNPYMITINRQSGVSDVAYDGKIRVYVADGMLIIKGIAAEDIDLVEVYDMSGQKLIRESKIDGTGISVSHLNAGAYIVVVDGNGRYTYHKIALR